MSSMEFGTHFEPPIREIIVFKPESFPLYRWDNCSPSAPPHHKVKKDHSLSDSASDHLPKLPFRRRAMESRDDSTTTTANLSRSFTSMASDDTSPRYPGRSSSPPPNKRVSLCDPRPSFLSAQAVGPCRRPPSRTQGFNQACLDLHQIPLKPITFGEGKHKLQHGFAKVLQDVVMDRCNTACAPCDNSVSVVFAIRRPGCGQCREHGMQLAELVASNPNVTLMGVLKETKGINSSIRDFYSNYFTFPLYLDEGWDLFHTIGNKKLSVFKLCARGAALEFHYAKKGIRNIPLGGDLFTQGGVLIFDKHGKLKFVYYETFGKPLDMEAIQWAIDQANN